MLEPTGPPPFHSVQLQPLIGYLIAPVFLCLAGWFIWGPSPLDISDKQVAATPIGVIDNKPVRIVSTGTPSIISGGYALTCMDCHRIFESPDVTPKRLTQHLDIKLNHGLNERCLDCHDKDNRNELVLAGGRTVSFQQATMLCAKCHGPTYRDWQKGMHGRTNGYWDKNSGEQKRLSCIQCHDPHQPAFASMKTYPGPNTLRMGDPNKEHGSKGDKKHNPLRRWSSGEKHQEQNQ